MQKCTNLLSNVHLLDMSQLLLREETAVAAAILTRVNETVSLRSVRSEIRAQISSGHEFKE